MVRYRRSYRIRAHFSGTDRLPRGYFRALPWEYPLSWQPPAQRTWIRTRHLLPRWSPSDGSLSSVLSRIDCGSGAIKFVVAAFKNGFLQGASRGSARCTGRPATCS